MRKFTRTQAQVLVQLEMYPKIQNPLFWIFKNVSQIDSFKCVVSQRIFWVSLAATFCGLHVLAFSVTIHGILVCTGHFGYTQFAYFAYMCVWEYTHTSTGTTRNMTNLCSHTRKQFLPYYVFLTHVWFSSCFWKSRHPPKKIKIEGVTTFKKEKKVLKTIVYFA